MFFPMLAELRKISPESALELENKYIKQREFFFKRRKKEIDALFGLKEGEEENLHGLLLLAEQDRSALENKGIWILKRLKNLSDERETIGDYAEARCFLGYLHTYWSITWRKFAELNKLSLAARWALNFQKKQNDERAIISTAEEDLLKELQIVIPSAEKILGLPLNFNKYSELKCDKKGILELDIKFLDYLKKNNWGPGSSQAIKNLSELLNSNEYNAEQRREKWDDPLFAHQNIALTRWLDRVRKYAHKKLEKPTALASPIFKQMSCVLAKGNMLDGEGTSIVNSSGDKILKINKTPTINVTTAESMLRLGIPLLSTITAHRTIRWLLIEVHKQFLMEEKEPRKLYIEGGYHRLGELSGAGNNDKIVAQIRKIIYALAGCVFQYKREDRIGEGNLLSFIYEQARGQKTSFLEIEMQPLACPGFVRDLPIGGVDFQEQRMLIPVVDFPTFIGRNNEHASQASFQWELFIEMRLRARELYEKGGILLNDQNLLTLAKKASMPARLISPLLDAWTSEGYLFRFDDCFYNVGSRHIEAQVMLKKAGEIESRVLARKKGKNYLVKKK